MSKVNGLHVCLRIFPTFTLIFLCYFNVGVSIGVLPRFVHYELGYSSFAVGLILGAQYLSILLARPSVGRRIDLRGPRYAVICGLLLCAANGLVALSAGRLSHMGVVVLVTVVVSRVLLGWGEAHVSTAGTLWGVGRLGSEHTGSIIAWSGIGSYGSLALGAPLGLYLYSRFGFSAVGLAMLLASLAGLALAWSLPGTNPAVREQATGGGALRRVLPFGLALALAAVGFGSLASFITLYFAARGWGNAASLLSAYGVSFVVVRLLCGGVIARWGGLLVALPSLAVETCGLCLVAFANSPRLCFVGAAITGAGFSLIFPALGVEAVHAVGPDRRGSALSLYTAFIDISLGMTGPGAGLIAGLLGYREIYVGAACCVVLSAILCGLLLYRRQTMLATV